jgi:hypothetical protein
MTRVEISATLLCVPKKFHSSPGKYVHTLVGHPWLLLKSPMGNKKKLQILQQYGEKTPIAGYIETYHKG